MLSLRNSTVYPNERFSKYQFLRENLENKIKENFAYKSNTNKQKNSFVDIKYHPYSISNVALIILNPVYSIDTSKKKYSSSSEVNIDNLLIENSDTKKITEDYEEQLITKILATRLSAANRIIKFAREFLKTIKKKKKKILEMISNQRTQNATKIQNTLRMFFIRKHIQKVISSDYVFLYDFKNKNTKSENVPEEIVNKAIHIKFGTGGPLYKLDYSPVFKQYYFQITKQGAMKKRHKVNFIIDGNIVIDPRFEVDYDNNGCFYNIVDTSMFFKKTKKSVPKIESKIKTDEKYWENIFAIKVQNRARTFSQSEHSDRTDASIDALLISNTNYKPKTDSLFNKTKYKSILRKTSTPIPRHMIKSVSFNDKVQYSN